MSSNIKIPKVCNHCNSNFIAKTTVTKFCSHRCASAAYKKRKKQNLLIETQTSEYNKSKSIDLDVIQKKEYLSISETCLLLGLSRMTIHRQIKANKLPSSKVGGRVIIKRADINNLIN